MTSLIREELATATTQWTLGTFGAIAEFLRDLDEPVELGDGPDGLFAVTDRGGIGFDDLSEVKLFASETAVGQGWSHRIALCLPEAACAMNRRSTLTELGPDEAALRQQDRAGMASGGTGPSGFDERAPVTAPRPPATCSAGSAPRAAACAPTERQGGWPPAQAPLHWLQAGGCQPPRSDGPWT